MSPTTAVIEAAGVGYNLSISLTTQSAIQGLSTAKLYTHLYTVQDQSAVMYGFATQRERALFRLLISVSGVGGGTARIMLSSHSPEELSSIIATGNVKVLTSVKGIGAKTAEVIIVKLRDKVVALSGIAPSDGGELDIAFDKAQEAQDALLVLGFAKGAVQKAIKKILAGSPDASVEDIIRQTLSIL